MTEMGGQYDRNIQIDITGKYVLIAEQKFYNGHVLDVNTYIYTKNDKNEWVVYYTLNIGKGFD